MNFSTARPFKTEAGKTMIYKRDGDRITLTLSQEQFDFLLMTLGVATGAAYKDGDLRRARETMRLANSVNEGNPNWTPLVIRIL